MPDRHLRIPPGHLLATGYVSVWKVRMANRERMAVGDVDRAFQRLLQLGQDSIHPCPNGHWEKGADGERFVIEDGRHEFIASLMLGRTHILVAWLEQCVAIPQQLSEDRP